MLSQQIFLLCESTCCDDSNVNAHMDRMFTFIISLLLILFCIAILIFLLISFRILVHLQYYLGN